LTRFASDASEKNIKAVCSFISLFLVRTEVAAMEVVAAEEVVAVAVAMVAVAEAA
jgi:hypothetical protein